MSHPSSGNNRKLHAALLISMLLLFLVVYNRRLIRNWYYGPPALPEIHSPSMLRAGNTWNRLHADSSIYLVKDGDLVLRSGADAISNLFKKVNSRDRSYSHAGLVFLENGYPMVYHCIGSADAPDAPVRRDSLAAYIGPLENTGYAIYRYALKPAQVEALHDIVRSEYKARIPFDTRFDLSTDSALYCTEFVYKAVTEATHKKNYFNTTKAGGFTYVAVDDLFLINGIKMICKIVYKQ